MEKSWFDLSPQIKRTYDQAVWVPLRLWETKRSGKSNEPGFSEIFEGAHALLVPTAQRELGEAYSWSDNYEAAPWAEREFYKPSDVYSHDAETDVGFKLVLRQTITGEEDVWHLHQDLVIALRLLREGDRWLRPEEAYIDVVRLRRGLDKKPVAIEIRSEHLRDYLRARRASLRIATYRERTTVVYDREATGIPEGSTTMEVGGGRLERRAIAVDETGAPFGSGVGVFRMGRTDVDPEADVPIMGPETPDNVAAESWSFTRDGEKRWRVNVAYWRDEWIEPANSSIRVGRDKVASEVTFIAEADGTRINSDKLNNEDIGRWLWFAPEIIASLLSRRGSWLKWHSRDTASISTSAGFNVHFGLNSSNLVTVYAHDVACQPEWERRFWSGFNVAPEGGVSAELLAAQVRCEPASTLAPEKFFLSELKGMDAAWRRCFGSTLVRSHDETEVIAQRVHRFRALNLAGLLSLAKDIARLTADAIDPASAQAVAPTPSGEARGSLKSLERALATLCDPDVAHDMMSPLFAAYELRLSDAHLPKSSLGAPFELLGIKDTDAPITCGYKMLDAVVSAIASIRIQLLKGRICSGNENSSTVKGAESKEQLNDI